MKYDFTYIYYSFKTNWDKEYDNFRVGEDQME